jgi:hypothetical protein
MREETEAWQEQFKEVFHWRNFMRLIIPIIIVGLISLAFGFAFMLIVNGIAFTILRLALYWQPAYSFYINAARLSDAPEQIPKLHLTPGDIFYLFIRLTPYLFSICAGLWLLFELGFCGQNLICILIDTTN